MLDDVCHLSSGARSHQLEDNEDNHDTLDIVIVILNDSLLVLVRLDVVYDMVVV